MSRGQIRDILSAGEVRRPSFSHIVQSGSPVPAIGDCGGGGGGGDMDATFFWRLSKLGRLGSSKLRFDDDFVDRLNYQFTGVLLFMFIGLIGIRQYVGKPIQCWIPQEFTRGWEEYTENYCWVSNTYFASINQRMPSKDVRDDQMIGYYQWAPILLGLQSLMFYLPCLIWRYVNPQSGFNVRRILQVASDANCSLIPEQLQKSISFIARHMDTCLYRHKLARERANPSSRLSARHHQHRQAPSGSIPGSGGQGSQFIRAAGSKSGGSLTTGSAALPRCMHKPRFYYLYKCFNKLSCRGMCFGREQGNFLTMLYLSVKLLYLVNICGQLYLMEKFIGTRYTFYGIRVLWDLLHGYEWNHSGNFPRVTFCDLEAKKLGKNHLYSLQCVLPMNMFLEKIYIFLWFWHVLVGIATVLSLLSWLRKLLWLQPRVKFIRNYLRLMNVLNDTDKSPSRKFTDTYLRCDGCFLLYLIASNIGDLVAGDLVCELWHIYRHKRLQDFDEVKLGGVMDSRLPSLMLNNTNNLNDNPSGIDSRGQGVGQPGGTGTVGGYDPKNGPDEIV